MARGRERALWLALCAAIAIYTLGYLLWFSSTALGLYPVLDGREQLELARAIAAGSLPFEPFYRAPLYPTLLAQFIDAGVAARDLPLAARLANGALHLVNAGLVGLLARRTWHSRGAAALAALLYGLYPVALFFAADPLDITLAVSCLLGACLATLRALDGARRPTHGLACAGALLGAAMLTRPQTMVVIPLLALLAWHGPRATRAARLAAALLPVLVLGLMMGLVNLRVGGTFNVLPWQGAYNLWAANGPTANGRYFVQRDRLALYSEGVNPARVESEREYRAENPGAADDHASMSRYWQARTLAVLRDDPLRWLGLLVRKAWYLLNDFEQYDLKTYFVHKDASPWLRSNPLGWGVLLAAAGAALALHGAPRRARRVTLFALAYAAGLLLSYVSARFRLPLAPLLAVLAGGLLARPPTARSWLPAMAVATFLATLSFWPLPTAERERTVVQDALLEARAASAIGDYRLALDRARVALARAPRDPAARELLCVAAFNAWLQGDLDLGRAPRAACEGAATASPVAARALGVLRWRAGDNDGARALWRPLAMGDGVERDAARAALIMSGDPLPVMTGEALAGSEVVLLLARTLHGDGAAQAALRARLPEAEVARQAAALERLFAR